MSNIIFTILILTIFYPRLTTAYCDPSFCSSGCCSDYYNCASSYNSTAMRNCYRGDCSRIKCPYTSDCCYNGKCYVSSDSTCKAVNVISIVVGVVVSVSICICIVLCIVFIRRRRMRNLEFANRGVTHVIVAAPAQPVTFPMMVQGGGYPQGQYQQGQYPQGQYPQNIPINQVMMPQPQGYPGVNNVVPGYPVQPPQNYNYQNYGQPPQGQPQGQPQFRENYGLEEHKENYNVYGGKI